MPGPLAKTTVLDLSSVGPSARAAAWLADYGACVVKVAPLAKDAGAQLTPPAHAYSGGRGTQRIQLDLKSDGGRETFLRLTEHADVVLESFRPGVVARLGIGYDDVKSRNPRIVYCSTSGYGQTGPWSQWAGHDLNYLAVSGYLHNSERGEGGKPPVPGATVADSAGGGLHAVTAILAALVAREHTGDGTYVDVSVADGMLSLMALQVDEHLATGREPGPGTAPLGGRYACYDTYVAADGEWLSVAAIEPRFWGNLCRLLGLEQLTGKQYDADAQEDVRAELAKCFATRTRDEWVAELAASDTCVAPVLSPAEASSAAQFTDRDAVATAQPPTGEKSFRQLAPLLAGASRRTSYDLPDRSRTDTDSVLTDAGFTADEIAQLRTDGVIA
ncbi:MAG TPA: CaiB/BaiF CoA-transferase family protein [Mycobacteriales bacterium]|jgi:alpha-methylacyl-CoA racemase|nr:CaiB/BaiF CoA-transferase family protein [Mycobacteriales bacterium]